MARYKHYDYTQAKLLPITFSRQILPGTFEYTLHHIVENELDLSIFESKYNNDESGAPAYDPAILLKIILYAYARGITSSREIEQCCRENVMFMALSADPQPHFTTIANFISTMADEIMPLFLEVLMICDEMGMIGKEMFAIDGCKLPSNASRTTAEPRPKCLRHPERTEVRQVVFFQGRPGTPKQTYRQKMIQKIDTPEGRQQYGRRLGIVEPVFGNITSILGLKRFSLRGKVKVDNQWKLYRIVHNLLTIHQYGTV